MVDALIIDELNFWYINVTVSAGAVFLRLHWSLRTTNGVYSFC
jgi:hypothetical protein